MEVLPRLGTSPSATFFRPSLWIPAAGVWGRLFAVGIGHLADSIQGIGGVGPAIDAGLGSLPGRTHRRTRRTCRRHPTWRCAG